MRCKVVGLLAVSSFMAVAAAGCGGAKSIPKAELIRKGDARCATDNRRINAIPQPRFSPQGATTAQLPEAASYLGKVNPIQKAEIDYLHGLGEPTEGKAQWKKILAGADQVVAALQEAEDAAKSGDLNRFKAQFVKISRNNSDQLARQFGFRECGQP
jgi:hypothetical protein